MTGIKSQSKDFMVRLSNPSDIPQIIELLNGFEFPLSEQHYRWKYLNSPWDSIVSVAEVEGKIIGHFGYIVRPFLIDNQITHLGMAADLFVQKEYRQKSVYTTMNQLASKTSSQRNIPFTYGFPNVDSYKAAISTSADTIGFLPLFIKIINTGNVLENLGKSRLLRNLGRPLSLFFHSRLIEMTTKIEISEVSAFPDSLDDLWEHSMSQSPPPYPNIGVRTKKFLDWRFGSCPDRDYKIIIAYDQRKRLTGYMVLREVEVLNLKEGAIVDIFHSPDDRETSSALIAYASEYFKQKAVDIIACLITKAPNCLPEIFKQNGFRCFVKRFNPRPWTITMRKTTRGVLSPNILEQNSWFFSWADCDIF